MAREKAAAIDLPRKWVLTDEQIVEACKRETRTIDQLMMVRGLRDKVNTADARKIVSLICKGLDSPKETWPEGAHKGKSERNVDNEVDLMMALVRLPREGERYRIPDLGEPRRAEGDRTRPL